MKHVEMRYPTREETISLLKARDKGVPAAAVRQPSDESIASAAPVCLGVLPRIK